MIPISVLVVEDERATAKGIAKQLHEMGYRVAGTAATGPDAVRLALETKPDLILMDISLRGEMDGVSAVGLILEKLDVPVIYLTSEPDDATFQRAKLSEPQGYVLKPYEDRDLRTAIEIGLYRHKMDKRLRENERWLAATLGSIGDGVIATNEQGRIRFLNALAQEMTGWSQADAVDRDVTEVFRIINSRTRQLVRNPVLEALQSGEPALLAAGTILIDRVGGERPIDDSAAPIRDVHGKMAGAVLVFRDVSERMRLEDHLRQAQKMEAIGRLAGGIAHDFNNIMTIISGFSEMMMSEGPSTPDHDSAVRNIHEAGKRAAELTRQIMAFSRKQMLMPSVLNLNVIVRDMGAMVKRLIGSNIEFIVETDPHLGNVLADPTQLGQVILNLAANARDAMPNGGRLVVSTANVQVDASLVGDPPGIPAGRYVQLTVSDNGAGMTDEVRERIFEPFFTTKDVGEGTGLGLSTVYGIVKQSNGHIDVSGAASAGTTFRIYFPLVEAEITQPEPPVAGGTSTRGNETILLVEDEDTVRGLVSKVLRGVGYTVLEAADGLAALALAARYAEPIDLLMTDVIMPQLSGREVAEQLVAQRGDVRVLYVSGYAEAAVERQGVVEGVVDFLQKPFKLETLRRKVRAVLDAAPRSV